MPLTTDSLINQLDASVLLLSGFSDNQTLLNAFIPDQVNAEPWYGSAGYSMYVAASGSPAGNKPVIRLYTGNLTPGNFKDYLNYTSLTVLIAAKRTDSAYGNRWQGLFSMPYNNAKSGITILSITDNANTGDFSGWGTYGTHTTTQSTSAMDLNIPVVVGMTVNIESTGTFYTNASATGSFTDTKSQGYYGIGGLESANGFFVGDIYEALIYNRVLTSTEISNSTNYLISKWFV